MTVAHSVKLKSTIHRAFSHSRIHEYTRAAPAGDLRQAVSSLENRVVSSTVTTMAEGDGTVSSTARIPNPSSPSSLLAGLTELLSGGQTIPNPLHGWRKAVSLATV